MKKDNISIKLLLTITSISILTACITFSFHNEWNYAKTTNMYYYIENVISDDADSF